MEIFLQWTPIIDGVELTDQPINLFAKGAVAPIPMIVVSDSTNALIVHHHPSNVPQGYIIALSSFSMLLIRFFRVDLAVQR